MKAIPQHICDRLELLCRVHSLTTAGEIVGLDRRIVAKIKSRGFKAAERPLRRRPDDFAIMAGRMTMAELRRHYHAGEHTVRRWAKEVSRTPCKAGVGVPAQEIPADLAEVVERLGPYGAADHYGVHYNTVKRWRKAVGLPVSWSRRPKKPAPSMIGWADRWAERKAA